MEWLAATPPSCSEPLDGRVVDCLGVVCICLGVEEVVHVFGKDRGDGMQGFVPSQAFRRETCHCANYGLEIFGKLVLNDGVKDSVRLQVWQFDSRHAMVFFRELDPHLFVECEPLCGVGRMLGIVAIHSAGLLAANVKGKRRPPGGEADWRTSA